MAQILNLLYMAQTLIFTYVAQTLVFTAHATNISSYRTWHKH